MSYIRYFEQDDYEPLVRVSECGALYCPIYYLFHTQ